MNTVVPQQIVDKLIELGSRDNIDEPSIATDFEQFRSFEYLGRIHWSGWHTVCEGLSIDEHIALLKAVVIAMRYSGWDGGSVAAGIWVFKNLEARISNKQAAEIAKWVIERSNNPWMPFGNQRDRQLFVGNQDIDTSEDCSGTMLLKLKCIKGAEYVKREQAQLELQKQQQAAKVKRLELWRQQASAHLRRKDDQELIRRKIIASGDQLDDVGRLRLIVNHPEIPLLSFPAAWADVSAENLIELDDQEINSLIDRLARQKKGPWVKLIVPTLQLGNDKIGGLGENLGSDTARLQVEF